MVMKKRCIKSFLLTGMIILITFNIQEACAKIINNINKNVLQSDSLFSKEIQKQVNSTELDNHLYYPKSVLRLYKQNGFKPAWIKPQNGEGPTWQAMLMLDCVLQFGLSHADYHPKELLYDKLHNILDTPGKVNLSQQARFDIMLTDAIITFMNNLHYGKLNPDYPAGKVDGNTNDRFQADRFLIQALKQTNTMGAIASVQPKSKEYRDMQRKMHLLEGLYQNDCYEIPQAVIRKIAINMERLRWVNIEDSAYIHINIPSYTLKLHLRDSTYLFRIIAGKPGTPTPTLQSTVGYFTTAPKLKVPVKILPEKILSKAKTDNLYLQNNQLATHNKKSPHMQPSAIDAPGSITFNFPNIYNINLHDIKEQAAFMKKERNLSNGSIGVEHAEKLGTLLLKNDNSETKVTALHNGMLNHVNKNITLKKPLPIKITYLTCEIKDGEVVTYNDIYSLDNKLEMKLYNVNQSLSMR
jgi:murein L,D-transpeptidase YcbB/YkuD